MKINRQNGRSLNPFLKSNEPNPNGFWRTKILRSLQAPLFLLLTLGVIAPAYAGRIDETEPNPCSNPNTFSAIPAEVFGYKALSDVDFYKYSAPAGTQLRVTMKPDLSSPIPLSGLKVGFFTSDCTLQFDQARYEPFFIDVTVPQDGVFILGATEINDYNFGGNGPNEGGYILSVTSPPASLTTITGRVVDANTHIGLQGYPSPYVSVRLQDCSNYDFYGYCRDVSVPGGFTQTNSDGTFTLQGDFLNGDYRIQIYADSSLYEVPAFSPTGSTGHESIPVTSGGSYDFGDIPLTPIVPVKSISGRVIDKLTGKPLSGTVAPFARVRAEVRGINSFYRYLGDFPVDKDGKYVITASSPDYGSYPLPKGNYYISAYADQYQTQWDGSNTVELLDVGAGQAGVAPDLALLSNPIRITDIKPCQNIPAQGGKCNYSYKVTLGSNTRFNGTAWSLVYAYGTGGFVDGTHFQACRESLGLNPAGRDVSKVIQCQFTVPAKVPESAHFCPDARIGQGSDNDAYFTVQGMLGPLFCLNKQPGVANLKVLQQHEASELIRHKLDKNHR